MIAEDLLEMNPPASTPSLDSETKFSAPDMLEFTLSRNLVLKKQIDSLGNVMKKLYLEFTVQMKVQLLGTQEHALNQLSPSVTHLLIFA
ncbi:hypothetical protein AVEN_142926-1 [Araneus ventricosus]|uniref:Uncharacterized protein n=1 Tax=Araneus ventricosus TaxID=182803 RepID=A0A4Y2T1S6_ARAVE|nr:hypothetical protein AVEN_142926-1 [Araneus ventricosus]